MRFTPVRRYVLLDLVAKGKLVIERNGALEPSTFEDPNTMITMSLIRRALEKFTKGQR